jgi:two-component system nitrogen regulation response regulator NtrX
MRGLRERIEGMAPLWVPVLLSGEPGSGRATAAALLHTLGPAARGEWVRMQAAAFAPERRLPFLGTVYLEGVERMPARAQGWWRERLRRMREPGEGGGVRWVASTGDPLALRTAAPDFDRELEQILVRFAVRIPPLRERMQDLTLHVAELCARLGRAVGRLGVRLSPQALELLRRHHWPGNVRELEEVLGRAIVFSKQPVIRCRLLESVMEERGESVGAMRAHSAMHERERLLAELRASGGNVARTAEALGKSRTSLYRLIERHRIALSWHRRRG